MFANKSLKEIAGYDSRQLRWIVGRERDNKGNLVRERVAGVVPVPFDEMYRQAKRSQGFSEDEIDLAWEHYLEENPDLAQHVEDQHLTLVDD